MTILSKPFSIFLKKYKHKHKCCICGEDSDCCLEFHHIIPEDKLFSLRSINENKYSKQLLIDEFNKTCIICGNCHRKIHNGLLKNIKLKYNYIKDY